MDQNLLSYQKHSGLYLSPEETEIMSFKYVNDLLEKSTTPERRQNALFKNQKLWQILLKILERSDCPLNESIRENLIKIGAWSISYANQALTKKISLTPLIAINCDMIEGISQKV